MTKFIKERMTAKMEGDFVVFLIGMRINRFWKFNHWLPAAAAMPKMLRELSQHPESGFLGYQLLGGIPPVALQYWRSFAHLEAYAKDRDAHHYPAWKAFNEKIKSGSKVGIWHETFLVRDGEYECVYRNMPAFGLGKAGIAVPATGHRESAAGRMGNKV